MPLKRGQKGARFGFVFLGQGHKLCCFSGLGIGLETERTGIAGTDPGTDHGIGRGEIDPETATETGHVTVAVGGTGIATGTEIADGTVPGIGRPGAEIQTGTVYLLASFCHREMMSCTFGLQ